ncbi:hypothetical protein MMC11_007799, partial [Xylographa trunciseda]|nr:hypothetical protein [Xylographa trunciseda]
NLLAAASFLSPPPSCRRRRHCRRRRRRLPPVLPSCSAFEISSSTLFADVSADIAVLRARLFLV